MISTAHRLATLDDLHQAMRRGRDLLYPSEPKIMVGTATCGLAAGAEEVLRAVREEAETSDRP